MSFQLVRFLRFCFAPIQPVIEAAFGSQVPAACKDRPEGFLFDQPVNRGAADAQDVLDFVDRVGSFYFVKIWEMWSWLLMVRMMMPALGVRKGGPPRYRRQAGRPETVRPFSYTGAGCQVRFVGSRYCLPFFVMDTRFGEYMQYRIYCTTFFQICYHCLVVIEKMQVLPACHCRPNLPGSVFLPGKTVI